MKAFAVWAALLLALQGAPLRAGWSFADREALPVPEGLSFFRQSARDGERKVAMSVVSFALAKHSFVVMDNPEGRFNLGSASRKRGVLAAVNGGYFHEDRTPLGLVVRQGVTLHPLEKSRLLGGLVVVAGPGPVALRRTAEFRAGTAPREALQAGPFLVDDARPVAGLEATRSAARTVVFTTTTGRAGFMTLRNATLAETAALLASEGLFSEGRISRALNLDGGTSSALWVDGADPYYEREWKGVRNYLGIVPRAAKPAPGR